ncbi:MAG: signal recognition particle-docking protein FtsY [Nitrososphaerales archaeon]|uniref:Signal recognition particle-docking protein (FtsY) n=1 Tax=uncultured marine thaumarchaeote AD1000_70_G10 TaxID=1455934 RepID=A0A075G284_9ARCH|nr:signal recognition particle-docking protein (ftsY) [uncultured marine thaumarchaeote AD1000_70_G10]MCH2380626.1 signal recognition particle-docking protein FtsY [Nitrososphaerales archaeon]
MLDKVKNAVSNLSKIAVEKQISEKELDEVMENLTIELLESEIPFDLVEQISENIKKQMIGKKFARSDEFKEIIKNEFTSTIKEIFQKVEDVDLIKLINSKESKPFKILIVGINGSGKTTTVAKIGHLLKENNISSVIVAGDTFRSGAIEQIKEHADRLELKLISQKYGSDPAAVARDGVEYSKTHSIDAVIIDTSGRVQTNSNLMQEVLKIKNVVNPDFTVFIGDSLAGNDLVSQTHEFFKFTEFNGSILTKVDADVKGGAILSILSETGKPIIYIGTGQEYKDLEKFNEERFLSGLFQ